MAISMKLVTRGVKKTRRPPFRVLRLQDGKAQAFTCTWMLSTTEARFTWALTEEENKAMPAARRAGLPIPLGEPWRSRKRGDGKGKCYWLVNKQDVYVTNDFDLTPEDAGALVNEEANKRRLRLEKAHAVQAMTEQLDTKGRREPIGRDIKITVWQRDGGRCVECGSNENLEFDHIIPVALGGANTVRNIQLLCEPCNRRKGATLG